MKKKLLISRVSALLVAAFTLGIGASSAMAARGERLTLAATQAQAGLAVLRVSGPHDIRGLAVSWGDGQRSVAVRECDGSSSGQGQAQFAVPHRYLVMGHYLISARVTRAGCGGLSRPVDGIAAERRVNVRVRGGHDTGQAAHVATAGSSSEWITYSSPYQLANPVYQIEQGTVSAAGGCTFPAVKLKLTPSGPTAVGQREDALNSSSCETLVETGTPPASALAESPRIGSLERESSGRHASPSRGGVATAARANPVAHASSSNSSGGYIKSFWFDPNNIHVTEAIDTTEWTWNGSCVVSPVYGGYEYNWFFESGYSEWHLRGNSWENYYTCHNSVSSSIVHFENSYAVPCGGATYVTTNLEPNRIEGVYNGNLVGEVAHWKEGASCKEYLTFHTEDILAY